MRAIAQAMLERFQDQITLDLCNRAANQIAGDLFCCQGRMCGKVGATRLIEARAVR